MILGGEKLAMLASFDDVIESLRVSQFTTSASLSAWSLSSWYAESDRFHGISVSTSLWHEVDHL